MNGSRKRCKRRPSPCWLLGASVLLRLSSAHGEESSGSGAAALPAQTRPLDTRNNGVYGRFKGDLDLAAGLSTQVGSVSRSGVQFTGHYYSSAGLWGQALLQHDGRGSPLLAAGVDLRPAFLPRWVLGLQRGPALLDLFVDSISLAVGGYADLEQPDGVQATGLLASLGFGVPLLAQANGPWIEIRGATLRPDEPTLDTTYAAQLTLSWHWLTASPWRRLQRRGPQIAAHGPSP